MANLKAIVGEITRALCVLALVVFAFGAAAGPAPQIGASPAVAAAIALTTGELCGGGFGDDQSHVACHACRTNTATLPPAPCVARPVAFAVEPVAYTAGQPAPKPALRYGAALSRAPPTGSSIA